MPKSARKPSTYVDFKAVKAAVSIEAVLERYELLDDLEAKDDGYSGDCPFHEGESQRPFHVSLSKNAWYCFGCEEGGNVLDFVARMEDVSIKKAAQLLAEWFEVESARKGPKRQRGKPKAAEADSEGAAADSEGAAAEDEALSDSQEPHTEGPEPAKRASEGDPGEEFANRPLGFSLKNLDAGHELLEPLGFDRDTIERFEAGYCAKGMMKGCLAIPIHSPTGELLAYAGKALDNDDEYKYPPKFDRSLELYNLHRAIELAEEDGLILVADILDVWRLTVAGFPKAVALMSDEMSSRQEALLTSFVGEHQRVLVLWPKTAERDAIVKRLASQAYVKVMDLNEFFA
ncbi:MAG: hypothetical protein IH936_11395 [Acidobacteria bacterium]|nr:hypothetical protein [Acidobacteriota bacterium]